MEPRIEPPGEPRKPRRSELPERLLPRPSLPIVPHLTTRLDDTERERLERLAQRLLADDPLLTATTAFGPRVAAGIGPWPALVLEDHSWITLFERSGDKAYSYRALLLAQDGDLVAVGARRCLDFERYYRDVLHLGQVKVLIPNAQVSRDPLAIRCAKDPKLLDAAVSLARRSGGLNIIPYMGTGGVWCLAGEISEASGGTVRVAAPPPRLTRRTNDKLWFSEQVAQAIGQPQRPVTFAVFSEAGLAGRVAKLARDQASVAVKLTDSASSAGNIVLESAEVLDLPLTTLRRQLIAALVGVGWRGGFPLIVTAWEQPILSSPSVQLWISDSGRHPVIIEGIFDQMILGSTRVFSGSQPTALSPAWQQRIADQAGRLGFLFHQLGYYGRCSFDAILVGDSERSAVLHWIECNGRWGGTSLPMTLANRLTGDWRSHPFVVIERDDLAGPEQSVECFLESHRETLFKPGQCSQGMVLLSPGQIETGRGFELMIFGSSLDEARAEATRLSHQISGDGDP